MITIFENYEKYEFDIGDFVKVHPSKDIIYTIYDREYYHNFPFYWIKYVNTELAGQPAIGCFREEDLEKVPDYEGNAIKYNL